MSKGTQTTQNSTQKVELPEWVTQAQQNLINTGQNMTGPFLQTPSYMKAGFNPDQTRGFDLARILGRDSFNYPTESIKVDPSSSMMSAAQVDPREIGANMNPFIDGVVDSTRATMERDYNDRQAGMAAKFAAAGSYGGSGEALARGQLARGHGENLANTIAQLKMQGYGQAQAVAMANAQMRQQAGQFNAQQGANNAALNSNLLDADQKRKMNALQAILGIGGQQQQFAQSAINTPWEMLGMLKSVSPSLDRTNQTTDETKTTESEGGNPLQSILGLALQLPKLSDKSTKTDIEEVGKDPETGLMMYAFRYKNDPKNYPKVVGPMAQDVEKAAPHMVRNIGGKKVIKAA